MLQTPVSFVLSHKEEIWKLPHETRILRVHCKLSHHAATIILERCRLLQKIIFTGDAYALTPTEVREFLKPHAHLELESAAHTHLSPIKSKQIRELYARGDYTLDRLSEEFKIPKEVVLHVVKERGTHA